MAAQEVARNTEGERPPAWAYEFHGHLCPFMPIGYRMGHLAMKQIGAEREKDHGLFAFPELGVGHPQTCLMDGLQIATGCTYGKLLMDKTFWGKLATILYHPQKGAVRVALRPEFLDAMGKFEFFAYRRRGVEPSEIPAPVVEEVTEWMFAQPDDVVFKVEMVPDFTYQPVKGSFNRTKCTKCGEYVFDRYIRMVDGKPYCIPDSGYKQ
jgi:formylmethanofuran dehydrogenase subunit E